MPENDKQWLCALITVARVLSDHDISYGQTPEALRRSLGKLDRDKLFGVIAECLYMLLNPSPSQVVPHPSLREEWGTRIKKRLSGAKKKKKSRGKNRVPHG